MILAPMDQIKIVRGYLGSKYKLNACSKDEGYDCFTFTRELQKELFNRSLPDIIIKDESASSLIRAVMEGEKLLNWVHTEEPIHGCIVELSMNKIPHHIGTYIDIKGVGKGLIHCLQGAGVCFDPWITLKAAGWRRFIYNVPRNA